MCHRPNKQDLMLLPPPADSVANLSAVPTGSEVSVLSIFSSPATPPWGLWNKLFPTGLRTTGT